MSSDNPEFPAPPPIEESHLHYVGLIASAWANLELEVNMTIWRLAEVKPQFGACLTANIVSMHMRLNALISLAHLREISPELIHELNKFKQDSYGIAERRNRAVHDPWMTTVTPTEAALGQFRITASGKTPDFGPRIAPLDEMISLNSDIHSFSGRYLKLHNAVMAELRASASTPP